MKKRISLMLCLALILALAGCGNNGSSGKPGNNQPAGVNDVMEQGMADADKKTAENTSQPSESGPANDPQNADDKNTAAPEVSSTSEKPFEQIDVDLTTLSSTMVYSEVYNMMTAPNDYIDKTIKMKGLFAYYHDDTTGNDYFACIIQDATACCTQGIEFVLTDNYTYPDDYPKVNKEICVEGVFDTYQDGNYTYCTLRNAKLI